MTRHMKTLTLTFLALTLALSSAAMAAEPADQSNVCGELDGTQRGAAELARTQIRKAMAEDQVTDARFGMIVAPCDASNALEHIAYPGWRGTQKYSPLCGVRFVFPKANEASAKQVAEWLLKQYGDYPTRVSKSAICMTYSRNARPAAN